MTATPANPRRRLRVLALPAYRLRKLNPFHALLYEQVERYNVEVEDWSFWLAFWRAFWRSCDVWHLHHPDTVVFPRSRWQSTAETVLFRLLVSWARLRGIKVVWTVHDLDSHDGLHPILERWFWRYLLPRLDAYICLTESGRRLASERFPALGLLPSFVTPHGDFRDAYPNNVSKAQARYALDLPSDTPVLLNFGLIRPYKDVPRLIESFRNVSEREITLVIAGRVYDRDVEADIRAQADGAANVRLHLRWISFEDTQLYFAAADLVVLAYRRILNSGTLMLALSFARPVLAPEQGSLLDYQRRFGADWVRLYRHEVDSTELLSATAWAKDTQRPPLDWSGLDWDTIAHQTRQIYDSLVEPQADLTHSHCNAAGTAAADESRESDRIY